MIVRSKSNSGVKVMDRVGVTRRLMALRLAAVYKRCVKARNIYAHPWPPSTMVEHTDLFRHFMNTSQLILDLSADPDGFIRAQFECWNGPKHLYPAPNQLHTTGAVYRYNVWVNKNDDTRKIMLMTSKKKAKQGFPGESKKLARFCEHLGLGEKEVLEQECCEFSRAFLEYKKVWPMVSEYYCSVMEG